MYTIGNYMAQLMYGMCRTCTIDCSTGKQTARSRSLRASRQTRYQINTLPYGGRLEARNRAPHICQRGHHARCKDGLPHVTESASIAAITGLTSLPAERPPRIPHAPSTVACCNPAWKGDSVPRASTAEQQ